MRFGTHPQAGSEPLYHLTPEPPLPSLPLGHHRTLFPAEVEARSLSQAVARLRHTVAHSSCRPASDGQHTWKCSQECPHTAFLNFSDCFTAFRVARAVVKARDTPPASYSLPPTQPVLGPMQGRPGRHPNTYADLRAAPLACTTNAPPPNGAPFPPSMQPHAHVPPGVEDLLGTDH